MDWMVSALHMCIYQMTVNKLSGINDISWWYGKGCDMEGEIKDTEQEELRCYTFTLLCDCNCIYWWASVVQVDFALQTAARISVTVRAITCLCMILCVSILHFVLIMWVSAVNMTVLQKRTFGNCISLEMTCTCDLRAAGLSFFSHYSINRIIWFTQPVVLCKDCLQWQGGHI